MAVRIETKMEVKAGEFQAKLQEQLGDAGRKKLDGAAAKSVADLVRRHLSVLVQERHETAKKLGATPTNIIGRTAEGVSVRQEDADTFVVVPHKMFRRAFQDVTIAPRNAKALAIPVAGEAYDKAPRSFAELFVWSRKRKTNGPDDKGAAFLARRKGDALQLLFLLWRGRLTQEQDRSLLPADDELAKAAKRGISAEIQRIRAKSRKEGGAA